MKLLLDECVTRLLGRDLVGHDVYTVDGAGFKGLKNGVLLRRAASDGFEALITVDQNLAHQQNIKSSGVAVVILVAKRTPTTRSSRSSRRPSKLSVRFVPARSLKCGPGAAFEDAKSEPWQM